MKPTFDLLAWALMVGILAVLIAAMVWQWVHP